MHGLVCFCTSLRGTDTLSGVITLSTLFLPPFRKGIYFKRKKKLLLVRAFFSFRVDPFSEGFGVQERKQEVAKVASLVKDGRKIYQVYPVPLI